MGQYYYPVVGNAEGKDITVFDRSVNGEYTMAKLMEHSWWKNDCMMNMVKLLVHNPVRLAWVGDYAEQDDFAEPFAGERNIPSDVELPNVEYVWEDDTEKYGFIGKGVSLYGKFLVNHDKKMYFNCTKWYNLANKQSGYGWVVHPLSLLTAVGNDRGGGDYHSGHLNYDMVGIWAWNLLSVETKDTIPANHEEITELQDIIFAE